MKLHVTTKGLDARWGLVAIGCPEKGDAKVPALRGLAKEADKLSRGAVKAAYADRGFTGAASETFEVKTPEGGSILLVGLGSAKKLDAETLRRASASAVSFARARRHKGVAVAVHLALEVPSKIDPSDRAEAVVLGGILATYRFEAFKSKPKAAAGKTKEPEVQDLYILTDGVRQKAMREGAKVGEHLAEAVAWARDLANTPGNVANPEWMAKQARKLAKDSGLRVKVHGLPDLKKMHMGGLVGVGQGSENPPRLVMLDHTPKRSRGRPYKTVALVGKGITFDSGGISLKPGPSMDEMKFDKSGACGVLATMRAVAALDLPVRVVGILALAENLPSGSAYRPGDILTMASGKTVEVLNTDAEGRLVLADALWYAHKAKPDAIIDVATLTGAVNIALGPAYAGLMGSDEELIRRLRDAGERAGEPLWHLPIGDEYQEMIKGTYGDIKNIGGPSGGALTAGQFLRNFVEEDDVAWAHLDIAAVAWGEGKNPYTPKGATGTAVRTFITFLRGLY